MITAPRSWNDPERNFHDALTDPWYGLVSRLSTVVLARTSVFYAARAIAPVPMPITTMAVSSPMGLGSDSLPVEIELDGERTFLADSMQFQLELLSRHHRDGVFYVMSTFRGEEPDATHLNQFFHSEAEIPGGLESVMRLVEEYVIDLAGALVADPVFEQVVAVAGDGDHVERVAALKAFPRIDYDEAYALLGDAEFETVAPGTRSIRRSGEQKLITHFGGPVWLMYPPAAAVPFYQAVDANGQARSADLLMGIGEIAGCGERHGDGDAVRAALSAHGVEASQYEWYALMKDLAPLRTSGFGLGIERFLLWVLRHDDIRDLHLMPRLRGVRSWA